MADGCADSGDVRRDCDDLLGMTRSARDSGRRLSESPPGVLCARDSLVVLKRYSSNSFGRMAAPLAATVLLCAIVAGGADWPQFRGAKRDAFWNETGLLKTFPEGGLEVRWRRPVGPGWSSPVVVGDRVFITDVVLEKPRARERILCLDRRSGERRWTFGRDETYPDWAFIPEHGGGPASTPVVDGGLVYNIGRNGAIHGLSAEDGSIVWRRDLREQYELRDLQCRPSPLIDGDRLIVFTGAGPDASVMALNKRTGATIWKALNDSVSNSSPLIVEAGGARQLIVWSNDSVTSLNPKTGALWWDEPMKTSGNDSIPTPVTKGNRLLIGGLLFRLEEARPAATILWPGLRPASRRILSNTSTAALIGEHVYSARSEGQFVCLDASTGEIVWETEDVTVVGNGASIHITQTPEAALLFTDRGDLIRAQLTPEAYREESRVKLVEPTSPFGRRKFAWAPPSFARGCVFARNDRELICARLKEGAEPLR